MKRRISQKAQRVLELLMGLGDPGVRGVLARYGFTDGDLNEGWRRLRALSEVPFPRATEAASTRLLRALDEWENHWFPIVDAVLRTNFPDVHEVVFRNLNQTDGAEVVVSVGTLVDRVDALGRAGERGRDARAYLARRGVTDDVIADARALLARVGEPVTDAPIYDPEARPAAEAHLWSWYLEWSAIARAAIKDNESLAALGFRPRGRKK